MDNDASAHYCDTLLMHAIDFAREAGKVQLKYFRSANLGIEAKQNDFDVVTTADKASEFVVKQAIKERYPSHAILSEESGLEGDASGWEWVVDPLDGTTNFSSGLPFFNVSIGVRHRGEAVVGVVYAPRLGELFTAVKGEGAFLNGEPIATPQGPLPLSHAVVTTGFPYDKAENHDNNLDNVERVMPLVRGLRRFGSAALELCYVAAGFLDAHLELNLHEWDVCAGTLIAREAGAEVVRYRPDRGVSVIVSRPALMPQLRPLIKP